MDRSLALATVSDVGVSLNRTYQRDWEGTKRDPEYIKQFNKDVLVDLVQDSEPFTQRVRLKVKPAETSATAQSRDRRERAREVARDNEQRAYQERMARIEEKKKKQLAQEDAFVQEMLVAYNDDSEGLMNEVRQFLEEREMSDLQKKQHLYNQWNERVFMKIQEQILAQLESTTSKDIARMRTELFNKFLEMSNKKHCLYRDIIIESEYDPMVNHAKAIKYQLHDSEDPLKKDWLKMMDERSMTASAAQRKQEIKSKTKDMFDVKYWDVVEDSAYHDHKAAMEEAGVPPHQSKQAKSNLVLDHYHTPMGAEGRAQYRIENPPGKRVFVEWKPGMTMAQQDLMHRTATLHITGQAPPVASQLPETLKGHNEPFDYNKTSTAPVEIRKLL